MRIETLEVQNWMPFAGVQTLELPSGPIAVVGRYEANASRSNWSGKTALLESIRWAFFGVHRKRYVDDLIHASEGEMRVRVVLTSGMVVERVKRRGKSEKLIVEHEGVTYAKREAQAKIGAALGFDNDDFGATVCFAQGDTAAIVEKTSGDRRKIVGQWLELEAWLRVAARFRAQTRELKKSIDEYRAKLEASTAEFDDEGYLEGQYAVTGDPEVDRAMGVGETAGYLFRAKEQLIELQLERDRNAEMEIARLDYKKCTDLASEVRATKSEIAELGHVGSDLEAASEAHTTKQRHLAVLQNEVEAARKFASGDFDGACPVTKGACPAAEEVRSSRDAARARYDAALAAVDAFSADAAAARSAFSKLQQKDRKVTRLREGVARSIAEIRKLQGSAQRYDPDAELSCEEIAERAELYRETRDRVMHMASEYSEARSFESRAHRIIRSAAEHRARLEDLEEQARIVAIASRCVGPTGVPGRIAEQSLSVLQTRANDLLSGTGLSFTFAWDRETKELAKMCPECGYTYRGKKDKACPGCGAHRPMRRADELEILVDDGSAIEDVKMKSGGAKVLVGSAIRLAAGVMLRDRRSSTFAVAQVDEPFGPLDAENRASLAQTFAGMLGTVGLEQAFVVSHDTALLDALPSRIEIVKTGNVSKAIMR